MAEFFQQDVHSAQGIAFEGGGLVVGLNEQFQQFGLHVLDAVAEGEFEIAREFVQHGDAVFEQIVRFGDDGFFRHGRRLSETSPRSFQNDRDE